MATYINATGTFSATEGDDTIVFDSWPSEMVTDIDALGGSDSLTVHIPNDDPMAFRVFQALDGALDVDVSLGLWNPQIVVSNVESVDLRGGSDNDSFRLYLSDPSGLAVTLNGRGGVDELQLYWSAMTSNISFTVSSTGAVTSSFGTFLNFENFVISAGSGDDTITTGSGSDSVHTGTGVDNVATGAGDDYINSQSSGGSVDGGAGTDYYYADFGAGSADLSVTIGDTVELSNGIAVTNIETVSILAGSGNDHFTVTRERAADTLSGGSGNDTLVYDAASTGSMHLWAHVHSGALGGSIGTAGGQLSFAEFENVSVTGTQYNDEFQIWGAYDGSGLSFDGGGGSDGLDLDFSQSTVGTSFTVAADGTISSNRGTFASLERFGLTGGSGADTFVTAAADDMILGGAGADRIDGRGGNDHLVAGFDVSDDGAADRVYGGGGNDFIAAGYGDSVSGGAGTDELDYDALSGSAGITADFSQLTSGGSITVAGATLTGIEYLRGISGTNHDDTIVAGRATGGHMHISGWAGNDSLTGSSTVDWIHGGDGNDRITGGLGADVLSGGSGNDTFAGTSAGLDGDRIAGLEVGDRILITDATLSSFTFSLSDNVLTYFGGSLTFDSEVRGRIVASAASGGGVQLTVEPLPLGTADDIAHQLVNGFWNGDDHRFNVTQGGSISVNITALTNAGQNLARQALAVWSDIIGVSFTEVTTGGQITFDDDQEGAFSEGNWANGIISSAHVNVSADLLSYYGTSLDSISFEAYVHEIGHALGLGHAGNYNTDASYYQDALFAIDGLPMSIMSYFDQRDSRYFLELGFTLNHVVTPMQADILAMSQLYGLSTATRTGDTTYGFNSTAGRPIYNANAYPSVAYTIFDNGGIDTLDYSGFSAAQRIDLTQESFSSVGGSVGNVSIARGTVIENAIGGAGADTILGNGVANRLEGRAGADVLQGGGGDDRLYGNGGADTLDGGAGTDRMYGGSGNDVYVVRDSADHAYELAGEGTDRVDAAVTHTLRDHVENLTLAGTANINGTGNALANIINGNSAANRLYGLGGDDRLYGHAGADRLEGGAGTDRLYGGLGNDSYVVTDSTDHVYEYAGEGRDSVHASVTHTLRSNVERLYLTGTAATNATGNDLANLLAGNSAANQLRGLGANDVIRGAGGDDWIEGGADRDDVTGGTGADQFVFRTGDFGGATASSADIVRDFSQAEGDLINLDAVDANSTLAGAQSFTFIGTAAFSGTAGELRYHQNATNTFVSGDTNGDGVADFMIRLDGLHSLTSGDFVL